MIGISLLVLYVGYIKSRTELAYTSQINMKGIILGLLLILIDLAYNLYVGGEFKYFDFGMLTGGAFIILLNMGLLRFLKLDEKMISFATYFIVVVMLSYGFLFTGIPFILNSAENPFLVFVTEISLRTTAFFLLFINPNVSASPTSINFDGFLIYIAYPCSGVESIALFLSGIVAYFIAIREKDSKKIVLYAIIGIGALFFMNILRLMAIVLVGYHMGTEEMLFVHNFLGWVMFTLAMAVFWFLVFR